MTDEPAPPTPVLPDMRTDEPLRISIASPCNARWQDMSGDARARLCGLCSKQVYNLAAMTRAEFDAVLLANEGRVCVRLYQRPDGTVLTADCPVGRERLRERARRLAWGAVKTVAVALGAGTTFVGLFGDDIRRVFGPPMMGALANNAVAATPAKPSPTPRHAPPARVGLERSF